MACWIFHIPSKKVLIIWICIRLPKLLCIIHAPFSPPHLSLVRPNPQGPASRHLSNAQERIVETSSHFRPRDQSQWSEIRRLLLCDRSAVAFLVVFAQIAERKRRMVWEMPKK
jgi:hypothetical protein